jgi:hypothetical protein
MDSNPLKFPGDGVFELKIYVPADIKLKGDV